MITGIHIGLLQRISMAKPIENDAPNFSAAFGYTAEGVAKRKAVINGQAAIDILSDEESLKNFRKTMMEEDGIFIDGDKRLLGLGNLGVVARLAAKRGENDEAREVPGAIARVEYIAMVPSHIVLQPAFARTYDEGMMNGEKYKLYVVPDAPNIPDMPVENRDILNTFRVLKAEKKEHTFWDMERSAFAYLKNPEGEIIRYPDTDGVPESFRGRPIAFIRDLNAMDQDTRQRDEKDKYDNLHVNVRQFFLREMPELVEMRDDEPALKPGALEPAPKECVDACMQQYATTAKLADTLREHGVEPTLSITPPTLITAARMREIGTKPLHEASASRA